MASTYDALLDKVLKGVAKLESPDKMSDFDYLVLAHEANFIEYISPLSALSSFTSNLNKARKNWNSKDFLKFLKSVSQGKLWKRLSEEQRYYLIHGKEQ